MKLWGFYKIFFILILLTGGVYGVNTIRVIIPETTNDSLWPRSYDNQELYIQSWALQIVNRDTDTSLVWDYFSGYYYDSVYGIFHTDYRELSWNNSDIQKVQITNIDVSSNCNDAITHQWYKLEWFSYSEDFWAMNFNHDANNYVFICVPRDENSNLLSYLWWNAFSELIGTQYFGGIEFDGYVDRSSDHRSQARFIKIEWISSSQNQSKDTPDFENDVRILGNVQKSSLRRDIFQNIFRVIKNPAINNWLQRVNSLSNETWSNTSWGNILLNGRVLYFWSLWANKLVELSGSSDISGSKTLVVEWWDILINWNITDTLGDDDILWIIAIQKDGIWGNIIIDSGVTDIHAIMYADRSLLSSVGWSIADGNTFDSDLANQLYIRGSLFSENTIWWAINSPYTCPFFEDNTCDEVIAKKYDLSFLRRYILVTEVDDQGNETGNTFPWNAWSESEMWDGDSSNNGSQSGKSGYRIYPLVIEYNPSLQTTPPPLLWN